jgi:hypothetical protein
MLVCVAGAPLADADHPERLRPCPGRVQYMYSVSEILAILYYISDTQRMQHARACAVQRICAHVLSKHRQLTDHTHRQLTDHTQTAPPNVSGHPRTETTPPRKTPHNKTARTIYTHRPLAQVINNQERQGRESATTGNPTAKGSVQIKRICTNPPAAQGPRSSTP